jgi:hypothetical protein
MKSRVPQAWGVEYFFPNVKDSLVILKDYMLYNYKINNNIPTHRSSSKYTHITITNLHKDNEYDI